jgi:hypothetical protein
MIDLAEYVWHDIENALGFRPRTPMERFKFRESIDKVVEMVEMERARQIRQSMRPPRRTPAPVSSVPRRRAVRSDK